MAALTTTHSAADGAIVTDPETISRRIKRLEAVVRRTQRTLETVQAGGQHGEYGPGGSCAGYVPGILSRCRQELAELSEQLAHWQEELEVAGQEPPTKDPRAL